MINIQAREITDNLASLVKQVDGLVDNAADRGGSKAFVVLVTDDADSAAPKLEQLAEEKGIKNTPLTIFDGIAGPRGYNIHKDAEVTVMMWKGGKVAYNHAFAKGELDEEALKAVLADAKKHVE